MNHTTKNRTHSSLKRFEEELLENGLLRIGTIKKEVATTMSIENFIVKFLKEWNNYHGTYNVDTNRRQTSSGRRRSSGDIFRICKYYYPNCRFKKIIKLVSSLPYNHGIDTMICSTINKRVFFRSTSIDYHSQKPVTKGYIYNTCNDDEFGKQLQEYLTMK